jgi:hypothetical protein
MPFESIIILTTAVIGLTSMLLEMNEVFALAKEVLADLQEVAGVIYKTLNGKKRPKNPSEAVVAAMEVR